LAFGSGRGGNVIRENSNCVIVPKRKRFNVFIHLAMTIVEVGKDANTLKMKQK